MKFDSNKEKGALLNLCEVFFVAFFILGVFILIGAADDGIDCLQGETPFKIHLLLSDVAFATILLIVGWIGAAAMIRRRATGFLRSFDFKGKPHLLLFLVVFYCTGALGVSHLCHLLLGASSETNSLPSSTNHWLSSLIRALVEAVVGLGVGHYLEKPLGFDKEWHRSMKKKLSFFRP